jgi:hypothetical protein
LALRVLAADGGLVGGGILDLDCAVVDPKLGAAIVGMDQNFLRVVSDDVAGEGGGLGGDRPDVEIVDIYHTWDLLESFQDSHVIHLGEGQERR